jgi:signal transduction histidine kinase
MERLALQAAAALGNAMLYRELEQANLDTQQLTRRLIKIQEDERHKVSRDLTDNVAQIISSAKVISETLFDDQSQVAPGMRSKAAELTHRLQTSIRAIRRLSEELRPPSLDQLGLVSSVYSLCREFYRQRGLKIDFYSAGLDQMRLDFEIEINLYRIVQEALENVVKHARTSEATVRLLASFPNIILRIEDNGCGFEIATDLPLNLGARGVGLKGMQERAKLLRGKLKIHSRAGEGTRILVVVPYTQEISVCF